MSRPKQGYVVYTDSRRAAAGRRLQRTLEALRAAGIPAHGAVYDDDPLSAVKDVLASERVDEIIVSTHPATKSGWLRKDLVEEVRRAAAGRPVEHIVSDVAARAGVNVLVVANETVLGEALLDRIRARASERACELPDRLPAERSPRRPSIRRPSAACAPRSPRSARKASTCTVRSPIRTRSRRRCTRSPTSGRTRSSSRPTPASARAGFGATSSGACARRAASRSTTSSSIPCSAPVPA